VGGLSRKINKYYPIIRQSAIFTTDKHIPKVLQLYPFSNTFAKFYKMLWLIKLTSLNIQWKDFVDENEISLNPNDLTS